MKKRIFTAFFSLIMVFSISALPTQAIAQDTIAQETTIIAPRWTNCASIALAMSYSDGTISWSGSIQGYRDTTKITANYTLEKRNSNGKYTFVDSWTGLSGTRYILNSSGSASDTKGTYRLTLSGTVQTDTYSESISSTCIKTFS